ncbi:oligosaccharide flippase family protein [Micromonospora chalcea]|uniref:oligosaccharide flippase family protein n=1 Tax=Micromonospora chalcea TaxID=1874 RepID=UPI0033E92DB7
MRAEQPRRAGRPGVSRSRLTGARRGVLSIASGTVGGQVLLLAAAPVLARLYTPADFGVFTVIATLVATVGAVAALRLEMAVPLPAEDRDADALVALGLVCALVTGTFGTLAVALAGRPIADAYDQPALRVWLWLVPWAAAAMGCLLVLNQLAVRHRRYAAIGRRNFLQAVATLAAQVLFGAAGVRAGGLSLGLAAGQVTGALMLAPGARLRDPATRAGFHPRRLWRTMRRYRRFPLVLAPSGLVNVLGNQLPVLLIAFWYGGTVAGWLGLTQRVLAAPVALAGTAVAQVYLGELARLAREAPQQARAMFLRASRQLIMIAVPAAVVALLAAPAIFRLVFGAQWASSGAYAQALAVGVAAQLVASPLSQTLVVFGRQNLQLAWDTGRVVVVVGAVAGTWLLGGSALAAVWAFGIAAAVSYIACWLLSLTTVRAHARVADRPDAGATTPRRAREPV